MTSSSADPEWRPESDDVRQVVRAEGGFAYGVIGADIHVFGDGMPLYLLENWRPAPHADPQFLRELPSRMLNARFAVVDFTGRDEELAELRGWREQGPRLAARWLHAPGGQGKTRLAHQFAQESLAAGWKVVTATHGPGTVLPPPGSQDLRLDGAAGLLLIVDYADRWPFTHLKWLMKNSLLHEPGIRTRVLMLARSADVWPAVRATLADGQIDTSTQYLRELPDGTGQRAQMFIAARGGFAAVYGIADWSPIHSPGPLEGPDFGLSLALHIGALVAVDAYIHGIRPPQDMVALTIYLLDREHAHWAHLYGDQSHLLDPADRVYLTPPAVMNRAVFTAVLTGALSRSSGTDVLAAAHPAADVQNILDDHATCYPPADPTRDTVLEPLYPDRLAEDFVALTLPGHAADYPPQSWASQATTDLLARAADGTPRTWNQRALTLLTAAAERWPHVGPSHLYPLLHDDPRLALDAGTPVLTAMAALPDISADLLWDVADFFPRDIPADLAVGCASVNVRLAPHYLSQTDDPIENAMTYSNLSAHLSTLGRFDEAVQAGERGVAILRQSAEAAIGPERNEYEKYLAQGLNNLSNHFVAQNQSAQAIGAALEAVNVNRRLVQADPAGGYQFHLAVTLANLGSHLSSAGQRADAFTALRESAEIYQQLAQDDPAAESGLAVALTNLGGLLGKADSTQEALGLTREASVIWRRMAESNPDAYEPDLALTLINLASQSRGLGQLHDGLQAAVEATAILRRLATAHPRAHEEAFARSLDVHRSILADTGQLPQALDIAQEAVEVHRRRVSAESTTGNISALAGALHGLGTVLAAAGHEQAAQAANAEAAQVQHRLHEWLDNLGFVHPLTPPQIIERRSSWSTVGGHQDTGSTDPADLDIDDARSDPLPIAWGTTREIARAAKSLARAKDWSGLWELTCSVPIADACHLAALVPLKRWSPPDERGRAIADSLAAMDHRHAARVAKACAQDQQRLLPDLFFNAKFASFAPNRAALTVLRHHPDTEEESLNLHDLPRSTSMELYRGQADHESVSCLGPDDVVAIRSGDTRSGDPGGLVRYTRDTAELLTHGPALAGARTVATVHGFIVGLDLAPVGYLGEPGEPLYQIDLSALGLWRGSRLAADPTATRIAVSDGTHLAITDTQLRPITATALVPASFGELRDLAFVSHDELLISGTRGGLCLWQIDNAQLRPVATAAAPRLADLFAVPAWGVIGGWAHGYGRPVFHNAKTLALVDTPRPLGDKMHLQAITASRDGRYVLYCGRETAGAWRWLTILHDLHEPSAWIHRPLASIASTDLPTLDTLLWAPAALGDLLPLLNLVRVVAAYRSGIR